MNVDEGAMLPAGSVVPLPKTPRGLLRRWAQGITLVAAWMCLGWGLGLDEDAYRLLGVPLVFAFQTLVRGESLRSVWVRGAPPLGWAWLLPAALLALVPLASLVVAISHQRWFLAAWMLAVLLGSAGAGYSLRHLRRSAVRPLLMCLLTAGLMGIGLAVAEASSSGNPLSRPMAVLNRLLLFFPAAFVFEEAAFRGVLDSHLHRPCERFGFTSALLGSLLWGLWHLPTFLHGSKMYEALIASTASYLLVGLPITLYTRKGGNLTVPALSHALIDAVRDVVQAGS